MNFSQSKNSCTLKIYVFEIPDNKNIGYLFSKYKLLSLGQANSSFDLSQMLTLRFTIPRASLPPSPSFPHQFLPKPTKISFQHNPCHVLLSIFCPTSFPLAPPQVLDIPKYQTICQLKPIKFNIKLYTDHIPYGSKRYLLKS